LGACVDEVDRLEGQSVPESDALVCSASSRCQQSSLEGTPANGFDGCLVLTELGKMAGALGAPDEEFVVIAARSQLVLIVEAPAEPTDLLLVPKQSLLKVLLVPDVSHQDRPISAPCRNERAVPGASSYPVRVATQTPEFLLLSRIPNRDLSLLVPHAKVAPSLRPRN